MAENGIALRCEFTAVELEAIAILLLDDTRGSAKRALWERIQRDAMTRLYSRAALQAPGRLPYCGEVLARERADWDKNLRWLAQRSKHAKARKPAAG